MNDETKVCVMGMGYVGLTLAVALADVGYDVTGVETNEDVVRSLNDGIPHFHEENLQSRLKEQLKEKRLKIVNQMPATSFTIYIISVGTPLLKGQKIPNLQYIDHVVADVGRHLKKGSLVCLRSTIPVGTTRAKVIPALEYHSSLKAGIDFHVAFTPERTIEGKALVELRENPQIVGGLSPKCVDMASAFFHRLTPTLITSSSLEASEFVKIIDNSYRDVRFAYANEIASIAEKLNLDATEVIRSANVHYPRNNIPVPSPGVGGACLSKDPHILIHFSKEAGYSPELISSARKINEEMPRRIITRLDQEMRKIGKNLNNATVLLAGFAFKGDPETADLRDSTSLWLLEEVGKHTPHIKGYDPVVSHKEIQKLGITPVNMPEGADQVDLLLIAINHRSYRNWDMHEIAKRLRKPAIVYDSWRMLNKQVVSRLEGITYLGTGI